MTQTKQLSAFVTGATGFLGTHLCQQLLDNNWQVIALCRDSTQIQLIHNNLTVIQGDILVHDKYINDIPYELDALFHTAASTNTWFKNNHLQTQTNIQGTQNMLELALNNKIKRFIHVSSVVVFGIHYTIKNITENLPKEGFNSWINYVKSKALSEQMVLSTKEIDRVIINPTHIIGPGDKHNWGRLIKMIAHKKLPSIPNGAGSFVDVRDVARGIIQSFHKGKNGENYLLGGTNMNFNSFVHCVANKLNVKPTKLQLPDFLLMGLAKAKSFISMLSNNEPDITPESVTLISDLYQCDSAKARNRLNYQNRIFDETLNDTIIFMKKEKLL